MPDQSTLGSEAQPTDWAAHFATERGRRYWPNEELVRWVGSRRFDRVLEVGCGDGANLWYLAERANEVCGVDREPTALALAAAYVRDRGCRNVWLREGDAIQLPCRELACHLVVDCMTSQHLSWADHAAAYREYARVLVPGGLVWIFHVNWVSREAYGRLFPGVAATFVQPAVLRKAVERAGFTHTTVAGITRRYPVGLTVGYTIIAGEKA